ncbi:MAG: papain fold toxin domain-containing protein [Cyanobacteriota bacterium]|nr:papain fold toxin domain-containing protein [Cyanobacteriota bacterium]
MTDEQLDNIRQIAAKYGNFQCVPCSEEIQEYLKGEQIGGKLIKISTKIDKLPFSIITNPRGSDRPIATNGFHQGIVIAVETESKVVNLVFDNIYPEGIPLEDWLNSFGGPLVEDFGGDFIVTEIDFS